MRPFDFQLRTRIVFGPGSFAALGQHAHSLGFRRTLVVGDPGIVAAGLVGRAVALLEEAGVAAATFDSFSANPDTVMVERGRDAAAAASIDSLIGLGGGSSLDCAKGINFLLTNGGSMRDYRGHGKASRPMLPMIGVPTTAGTGSDAQSYAIISGAASHEKMACGDSKAAFRLVLLDPELTLTQPAEVTATVGYDAMSHAVEAYVTSARTEISVLFAREAWRLLSGSYERVIAVPDDLEARSAMLLGSHYAGIAIEQSMLGATHACANPLTARYGTTHGVAIALMLPHVVRWNRAIVGDRYAELVELSGWTGGDDLASHLSRLARRGGLPQSLDAVGVQQADIPALAAAAATQWTGSFNPRPFDADAARSLYERAL